MRLTHTVALGVAGLVAASAGATIVQIDVFGVVDFNVIQGSHAGIPSGSPVQMSFQVESTNFLNSPNFPTRGYEVDLASFVMTVGGAGVDIMDPQPFGPAYFVLRDNDPAVDGFLLSRNVEFPLPIGVRIPGLAPDHELLFSRTFNDGTALSSLDILDAVGSYDFSNISSYEWTIGRFGNAGAEYVYQSMTISIVPSPGTLGLVGIGGVLASARRRR